MKLESLPSSLTAGGEGLWLDELIKEKGYDAKFVANVHDEWQLEVREDQAEDGGGGDTRRRLRQHHLAERLPLAHAHGEGGFRLALADGLDAGAERLRERVLHHVLDALLKAIEDSHA